MLFVLIVFVGIMTTTAMVRFDIFFRRVLFPMTVFFLYLCVIVVVCYGSVIFFMFVSVPLGTQFC